MLFRASDLSYKSIDGLWIYTTPDWLKNRSENIHYIDLKITQT